MWSDAVQSEIRPKTLQHGEVLLSSHGHVGSPVGTAHSFYNCSMKIYGGVVV
jgi:hypothetical protein